MNLPLGFILLFVVGVLGHGDEHGSHTTASTLTHGSMKMYFHFTASDSIWFDGWTPTSPGAMVGACIGLFLLAITDRWLSAGRGLMETWWRSRVLVKHSDKSSASDSSSDMPTMTRRSPPFTLRSQLSTPFDWSHDLARGAIQIVQSAVGFLLMLAFMSFNVGFIISIVVGLGTGEAMFGRFAAIGGSH